MKKTSAALLAAAILLTGCSEDAKPDGSSLSTTGSSPTTTVPTTTPASPTTDPTTDPNIPAAARLHTPAGAEAFVRYFYSRVNAAWTKPSAGLISALSSSGCLSCDALEATAADLVKKRQHYDGPPVTIVTVGSIGESSPGHPDVVVQSIQEHRNVKDVAGHIVLTDNREPGKFVVMLDWTDHGWSFATVKSLA